MANIRRAMIVPPSPIFTARDARPGAPIRKPSDCPQSGSWMASLHAAILEEAPFQATERPIRHPSLIYHLAVRRR